jgi:hypothetical protein
MSVPRRFYPGADGGLAMEPVAEMAQLRSEALAVTSTGPGATRFASGGPDARALEVIVDGPWLTAVTVSFIDDDGGPAATVRVTSDGSEVHAGAPTAPRPPPPGPLGGPVRVYYDDGVVEIFGPRGQARAEILYARPAVSAIEVSWPEPLGASGPGTGAPGTTAWALSDIWGT